MTYTHVLSISQQDHLLILEMLNGTLVLDRVWKAELFPTPEEANAQIEVKRV